MLKSFHISIRHAQNKHNEQTKSNNRKKCTEMNENDLNGISNSLSWYIATTNTYIYTIPIVFFLLLSIQINKQNTEKAAEKKSTHSILPYWCAIKEKKHTQHTTN